MRWSSVLFFSASAYAAQIPLSNSPHIVFGEAWNINAEPDIDSTAQLIFEGIASLMQHWPNTRYRNGHNIIPGTIAPGTTLYHGRSINEIPSLPDWTATDPEHSMLFCHDPCWHLTLSTTRPLKILYFDGSSAAKMEGGPMDSQDILLWGEIKPEWTFYERERIDQLCEWGKAVGLDGFVRMEMDFEIMLCNFTEGVEVASFLQLSTSPDGDRRPPLPGQPLTHRAFEVLHAGSWHNHYPGDTRIKLDISRLVSFYDHSLAPSLIVKRRTQERWQHRLEGITQADVHNIMHQLSENLLSTRSGSGIDWSSIIKVIIDRFAGRLDLLRYILHDSSETFTSLRDRAEKAQLQLRIMLQPYILTSAIPPVHSPPPGHTNYSWVQGIFQACSTSHTSFAHQASASPTLTSSERLILSSISDTNREICRIITRMWADGVLLGVDRVLSPAVPHGSIEQVFQSWKTSLAKLMTWLDWSVWVRCEPECSFEEICYLPTWPYSMPGRRPRGLRSNSTVSPASNNDTNWDPPKPKCIRRIEPYST